MIIQVEDTVSDNDCRHLMTIYDQHVQQAKVRDQTGHPLVYWDELQDAPCADEINPRLVRECLRDITSRLQPADPLYPETVILAALGAGGHHNRHADNCRQNERGDWVANHTSQRDVTAIYYLDDTFEGGEIDFERAQLVIKPRRGLLLAFPSDAAHEHEVFWCGAASDTRCRFGLRSNNASHWRIFRSARRQPLGALAKPRGSYGGGASRGASLRASTRMPEESSRIVLIEASATSIRE